MDRMFGGGAGGGRRLPVNLTPRARRAVQGQRQVSPPYPEAEASADELASLRGKPAPAWRSDGVVQRGGDCRLAGRVADEPGRPTMVFAAGHSDGADAPGGVPPRAAPNRRSDRLAHSPFRS